MSAIAKSIAKSRELIIPVRSSGKTKAINFAPPIDLASASQTTGEGANGAFSILGLLLVISALAGGAVSYSGAYTGRPEPMITVLFLAEGFAAVLGFVLLVKALKS